MARLNSRRHNPDTQSAVDVIQEIINANPEVFVQGNTFSEQWLMDKTGRLSSYPHRHGNQRKHVFNLLHVYSSINKVLAERGLYIAARDYYSYWEVLPLDKATARIQTYKNVASGARQAASIYRTGVRTHRAVWGNLTEEEATRAQSRLNFRVGAVQH